jgi:hypothetical protein
VNQLGLPGQTPRSIRVDNMVAKGSTMSDESRRKMSEAAKNRPSNRIGKKHTVETRKKISQLTRERTDRGKDHYNFKHGKAIRSFNDRRKIEYQDWRKAVFERDHYTCVDCGDNKGGNLRAHHLKSFADNPDLRFDVDNGITLCHKCHELRHYKPDSIRSAVKGYGNNGRANKN